MKTIVCIGSGSMGYALMKNAFSVLSDKNIFFTDIDKTKAQEAAASISAGVYNSNSEAISNGDYVFLAVKPQVLSDVLAEIAPTAKERHKNGSPPVLISMAAGWSIGRIQDVMGEKLPVVRIMPNTPALIGKGVIALAASPQTPQEKIAFIKKFLEGAGIVDIIDERCMDAVTGLSGSGPAFVYLFIEALADGGVLAGLPRDKALRYAAQTALGSAEMVLEQKKHPGELKDMVTSPGGTTIAGIAALEANSFRGTVIKAVEAAWKRAKELG